MKINPTNPTDPISAYKTSQIKKANVNDGFEINDKLDLSDNAKIYSKAIKAIKDIDEVRYDKVNEIKERIEKGIYTIDSGKIAEKMIKGTRIDEKA
ncbi:MAG TPA: flagellar biosynthesis anti-sigma factor FlgM [Clostridia bacterium]|jgi:negative regulator of flagellin synthesis FlgM|nr:flagellar biosynthesis anti-sigma factor FlgM [Clostridiaceae bacterium]HOA31995.1 flagellar biosynthesis anti-sigma factor FlgM [Clostridia bacterium]HPZ51936.1 flagellar biosynthesis anti-sigma factor FlgM [Clostridia bacterium]